VLPDFPYHPDPLATGFVKPSDAECACCGESRGYIYTGPVYAVSDLDEQLCLWCIADGSAAERFDATFTDDSQAPDGVATGIVEQVTTRTPGFSGWQQERWLYHCDDGTAFLGLAGWEELQAFPDALASLRVESADMREDYLRALDKDGSPTAYLFRCRHCGTHVAYSDCD
jgi:uncharacterized protein CbrC (UPF0167 family)